MESVTDNTDDGMCLPITSYPGFAEFPTWIESQFPDIIPEGTAVFYKNLNFVLTKMSINLLRKTDNTTFLYLENINMMLLGLP